ncbi:MAG: transposase, partial [Dehalococcoidales bacterium]|nr:transposase [Dehalococcoidales bacterium]
MKSKATVWFLERTTKYFQEVFPNNKAVIRLIESVLLEQQDEWEIGRRYFSLESMNKTLEGTIDEPLLLVV